jgi:hypothetical protein
VRDVEDGEEGGRARKDVINKRVQVEIKMRLPNITLTQLGFILPYERDEHAVTRVSRRNG